MAALSDWWAGVIDLCGFNQLCGIGGADTRQAGNNATVRPTASTVVLPSGAANTAAVNDPTASFTLDLIDLAVEKAKTLTPAIRPIKYMGDDYYIGFLHPYQVKSLRTNSSSGQWLDIQKAAMQGGQIKDNPIFTGSLGVYNNVILHESTRVQPDSNDATSGVANVYRAVLCGAQSAVMAFGQDNANNKVSWVEELINSSVVAQAANDNCVNSGEALARVA